MFPITPLRQWAESNGILSGPELEAQEVRIGNHTVISESDVGSTTITNSGDNPINIQLYPSGRAFFNANDTETVISTQNEWTDIAGSWDSAHMNYLTADGNGGMVYQGDVTTQIEYKVGGGYSSPSNNASYELAMFKDGVLKSRTPLDFSPPRQDEVLSLPSLFGFTDTTTEGMVHKPRVRCTSGATNLTIHSLSFTLRG